MKKIQRKKFLKIKVNKESLWDLQDAIKKAKIHILGISQRGEKGQEVYLKK
jgi:hypothetical protein